MQQNTSDHETNGISEQSESKEYPFIKEVIKPTRNRRTIISRILWIIVGAVAAGLIAVFVFVKFYPAAEHLIGTESQKRERIRVAAESSSSVSDEEAEDAGNEQKTDVSAESDSDSGQNTDSSAGTSAGTDGSAAGSQEQPEQPAEPVQNDQGPAEPAQEEAAQEEKDPVAEYVDLQKNLNNIAADSEKCVVQVTGIKSEMDYFNASYENEQQVTGITIAEDDEYFFILTENAPLADAEKISVRFLGQQVFEAEMIRPDTNTGLAVIRVRKDQIDEVTLRSIQIAELGSSYSLVRGEPVIALGSPMGYEGMVSAGTITSAGNDLSLYDTHYHLYTTDIIGTQSGSGVLINLDGKVVGIIRQSLGTSGNSIVQALGISEITGLIDTLTNNESRAYAGIRGETVTPAVSEKTGIPQGMLIREVETDAPAMLAGLLQFDVVVKLNDQPVTSVSDYSKALAECKPGQDIHITALRKGSEAYEEMTFQVLLTEI